MEQPFSTSKVTVQYFDPHDVYKLVTPGLIPRLPLTNLHWQSHSGPPRSIDTLHVDLLATGDSLTASTSSPATSSPNLVRRSTGASIRDDGFQTQSVGAIGAGAPVNASTDTLDAQQGPASRPLGKERRHQIPGLRQTPYLKLLFVRCDDNDSYKSSVRSEVRDWIKTHATSSEGKRKSGAPEGHDAFEWIIVHVVIPNTTAATQPRTSGKGSDGSSQENKTASRWRGGSSTLLEKFRADFNVSSKNPADHIAQIRIGINDVPYDMLPRVVPAVPSGYVETAQDAELAWQDLISKMKDRILASFDMRVTRYEEDIKEKDAQRILPGWNFCTFFILKEGLARGFESVGLVEDALVGYDELSVGLDSIIKEQAVSGFPEGHGGRLLPYTEDLKAAGQAALDAAKSSSHAIDEEAVDLESGEATSDKTGPLIDEIPISGSRKFYRDLILSNNVSLFDFRCYIFSRQISLLLRLGKAWSTREELLAKLREQQESVLHGVAPRAPPPKPNDENENLTMLAEVCRRTLEFIPDVSQVMRRDILTGLTARGVADDKGTSEERMPPSSSTVDPALAEAAENLSASFAFSVAQQILAQTSTKALPIPPSVLVSSDGEEPKLSIPEPKTMMHPVRDSSLGRPGGGRAPPSPNVFSATATDGSQTNAQFLKAGLEELAARRAELYSLCRNILEKVGRKSGWESPWNSVSIFDDTIDIDRLEDVSLEEDDDARGPADSPPPSVDVHRLLSASISSNRLFSAALASENDFRRLYETLTDKAIRHYTVANHMTAVKANQADLAVLHYQSGDYKIAAYYFHETTPSFGAGGWSLLELSMLVMYTKCLKQLKQQEDFVRVSLKLLTRASVAERERLTRSKQSGLPNSRTNLAPIKGLVQDVIQAANTLKNEARIPLDSLFYEVDLVAGPTYLPQEDGFSLTVRLQSLLLDAIELDRASMRMTAMGHESPRHIQLECDPVAVLRTGTSEITFTSRVSVPGVYKIDQLTLGAGKLVLSFERHINQLTPKNDFVFKHHTVRLYQRPGAFDIDLSAAKQTHLNQNNQLELAISTGWNSVLGCELSIKPATGGLRLLTAETRLLSPAIQFSTPPQAGHLSFDAIPENTTVTVSFPFSVEQDVSVVSVRFDVTFTTSKGTFTFSKTASTPIALALGVNVQDVFKHTALFSRFTVSTASDSPLRLYKSELLSSDVFDSEFGVPPSTTVMVFPRQPASLLYKIVKKDNESGKPKERTMYLKLYYTLVKEEILDLLLDSISETIRDTPLHHLIKVLLSVVRTHFQAQVSASYLETAVLTSSAPTSVLADVPWATHLSNLDPIEEGSSSHRGVVTEVSEFFASWHKKHEYVSIPTPSNAQSARSIQIPVDIPSVPVVISADIRLDVQPDTLKRHLSDDVPTAYVNQMLAATLRLQWTRKWNTAPSAGTNGRGASNESADLGFSFEVIAPIDTWLLGGRRKGHFSISEKGGGVDVPLLLVPLREGWLPYPAVEVREASVASGVGEESGDASPVKDQGVGSCEVDFRNLGEVIRVVADRERVTVSLDSSGPGGGPLVLESERLSREGRILA